LHLLCFKRFLGERPAVTVKLDLVRYDIATHGRIDSIHIGPVCPHKIEPGIAAPDRHGRRIQQIPEP
jgi:hypothetical protein